MQEEVYGLCRRRRSPLKPGSQYLGPHVAEVVVV